jgi:hypothetical protein
MHLLLANRGFEQVACEAVRFVLTFERRGQDLVMGVQVTDGITFKVFRMPSDVAIEAIETGAKRITDDAVERWRPMISHEMAFA